MKIVAFVPIRVLAAALVAYIAGRARDDLIDRAALPPGLSAKLRKHYPHPTEEQPAQVFRALREYFHLCRQACGRMLGMPSQGVDVAWHEFILHTRHYQQFCRKAVGRILASHPGRGDARPDAEHRRSAAHLEARLRARRNRPPAARHPAPAVRDRRSAGDPGRLSPSGRLRRRPGCRESDNAATHLLRFSHRLRWRGGLRRHGRERPVQP